MSAKTLNILSLFAGIQVGGLDLGLERAGMAVVGQVEIDPYCRRILARHWPEVPQHDDVRTCVDWWRSEPRPPVHVVGGGFPCQPVSWAGKGLGEADERWLWPAFRDVIRDLRPRYALLENVAALLGRGAGRVLGDLAEIGYDAEWDCIPAASVGAPHRRDRWFAVAYPAEIGRRTLLGDLRKGEPHPPRRGGELADSDRVPCQPVVTSLARSGGAEIQAGAQEPGRRGGVMADPDCERELQPPRGVSEIWRRPRDCGWWDVEPNVGRVAHGIPSGMDRLRGLGNAVVPQVAEHVGRLITDRSRDIGGAA